jgi:hypothetical protein
MQKSIVWWSGHSYPQAAVVKIKILFYCKDKKVKSSLRTWSQQGIIFTHMHKCLFMEIVLSHRQSGANLSRVGIPVFYQ